MEAVRLRAVGVVEVNMEAVRWRAVGVVEVNMEAGRWLAVEVMEVPNCPSKRGTVHTLVL
jgi:hypothetical protein